MNVVVGPRDLAPGRAGLRADLAQAAHGLVDAVRKAPPVALEGEVRGLELERGAELEEAANAVGVEPGDAGAAVGLDRDEALGGEGTQRGPDAVARDAVPLGPLALGEAGPRGGHPPE